MVRHRSLRWQLIVPLNAAVALVVSAFLVWDGVTEYHVQIAAKRSALQEEAANVQGQFLGQDRLATLVEETRSDPLDKACRRVVDRITLFRGASAQGDDMTVLGVEF